MLGNGGTGGCETLSSQHGMATEIKNKQQLCLLVMGCTILGLSIISECRGSREALPLPRELLAVDRHWKEEKSL